MKGECVEDKAGTEVDEIKAQEQGANNSQKKREKEMLLPPETSCLQFSPPLCLPRPPVPGPLAASVPGVAAATRAPSLSGPGRGSSGPVAAVPLFIDLPVPISVPLPVSVRSSASSDHRWAVVLLSSLQPLLLLLLSLLVFLLLLLLVPSLALFLPLGAFEKPLNRLVDAEQLTVKCPQPQGTKGGIKMCKTDLLLSVGKPVYTWSCFGL